MMKRFLEEHGRTECMNDERMMSEAMTYHTCYSSSPPFARKHESVTASD